MFWAGLSSRLFVGSFLGGCNAFTVINREWERAANFVEESILDSVLLVSQRP